MTTTTGEIIVAGGLIGALEAGIAAAVGAYLADQVADYFGFDNVVASAIKKGVHATFALAKFGLQISLCNEATAVFWAH